MDANIELVSALPLSTYGYAGVLRENRVVLDELVSHYPIMFNRIIRDKFAITKRKYSTIKSGVGIINEDVLSLTEATMTMFYYLISKKDNPLTIIYTFSSSSDGSMKVHWKDANMASILFEIKHGVEISANSDGARYRSSLTSLSDLSLFVDWLYANL